MLRKALGPCSGNRSTPSATAYKTYSANGFKQLYEEKTLDGVTPFDSAPEVTGDNSADQRIRFLAEKRGYRLRGTAEETGLVEVDGKRLRPRNVKYLGWAGGMSETSQNLVAGVALPYSVGEARRYVNRLAIEHLRCHVH